MIMNVKRILTPILVAAIFLSSTIPSHAALGVGEIDGIFCDSLPFPGFKTKYIGSKPKNTPSKRIAKIKDHYDHGNYGGIVCKIKYNGNGDVSKIRYSNSDTIFKYDKNGNIISKRNTYGNGSETIYEYDSNGKMIRERYDDTENYTEYFYKGDRIVKDFSKWNYNGGVTNKSKYKYDKNGNLIKIKSENYTSKFTYDKKGRLIKVRINRGSASTLNFEYKYDKEGYLSQFIQRDYSDDKGNYYRDYIYENISSDK